MIAAEWSLGSVIWTMIVFFFWVMAIWIFISIFADIFRRRDLSGGAKALWLILLFVLPFIGAVIYMIARPTMTEQDRDELERMQEAKRRIQGYSYAEEIERLAKLRNSGDITADEYEQMKRKAMLEL